MRINRILITDNFIHSVVSVFGEVESSPVRSSLFMKSVSFLATEGFAGDWEE